MIKGKIKIVNPETGTVKTQPMRSFNAAFLSYLSNCFGFGYNLSDSPWSNDPFVKDFTIEASASDSWGIVAGSGNASLSCSKYSLDSPLSFYRGNQPFEEPFNNDFTDASSTITFSRTFRNDTGVAASVKEIGVKAKYAHTTGTYWSYSNILFVRDVLDSVETVADGASITVQYDLEFGGELSYNFARLIANTVQSASSVAVKCIDGASDYNYTLNQIDNVLNINASDPNSGIVIGIYSIPISYKLYGKYGTGLLKYFNNCLVRFEVNNASKFTRFIISREFKNTGLSTLTVKELGLYVPGDPSWGGTPNAMLYKAILDVEQYIELDSEEFLQIQIEFKTEM